MKKNRKIFLNLIIIYFLSACGSGSDVSKVLRNEKITNTDEFLIKKKAPLSMPPEYDKLPTPRTTKKKADDDNSDIKSILKVPSKNTSVKNSNSSIEESILKKINK
ncbi:DUF3035 domain-containing protein [Pelagibacteraceae bacterium]|nr:DUF3035 domain-containing protein [Pelagibacteraceae bacterium]